MKKSVEIDLIYETETGKDEWGNPVYEEKTKTIFASLKSVYANEFYLANSQGIKPSLVFEIYQEQFENAKSVKYCGDIYTIIRTYFNTLDKMELICERKLNNEY